MLKVKGPSFNKENTCSFSSEMLLLSLFLSLQNITVIIIFISSKYCRYHFYLFKILLLSSFYLFRNIAIFIVCILYALHFHRLWQKQTKPNVQTNLTFVSFFTFFQIWILRFCTAFKSFSFVWDETSGSNWNQEKSIFYISIFSDRLGKKKEKGLR